MFLSFSLPTYPLFRARSFRTIAAIGAMVCVPSLSSAQGTVTLPPEQMQQIGDQISKQLQAAFDKVFNRKVTIAPALIVADPKTNTAVLEFSNATADTLDAAVTIGTQPPQWGNGKQKEGASQAGGLLADDEEKTPAQNDSIDAKVSLASWVQELPTHIKVAPGEKKKITVKLTVPSDVKPGEYSAWIVTKTPIKQDGPIKINSSGGDGELKDIPAGAKLVYRVEAK